MLSQKSLKNGENFSKRIPNDSFPLLIDHFPCNSHECSLLDSGHVVDGASGILFVEHKVSLHLCSADLCVRGESTLREPLCFRRRLRRVEPTEHLRELPVGAVAHVLF